MQGMCKKMTVLLFTAPKGGKSVKLLWDLNKRLDRIKVPTEQPRRIRQIDVGAYKMSEWNFLALFVYITLFAGKGANGLHR